MVAIENLRVTLIKAKTNTSLLGDVLFESVLNDFFCYTVVQKNKRSSAYVMGVVSSQFVVYNDLFAFATICELLKRTVRCKNKK